MPLAAHAFDLKCRRREIEQQTKRTLGCFQIRARDREVERIEPQYRFEFHDQLALDQQVESVLTDNGFSVFDRNGELAFIANTQDFQLHAQRLFID